MDQEKGKYTLGQNLAYVLRGVRRYDPWLFVFFAASTIVTAMLPFLGMYGPKWLIDELTGAQRPLALGGIILGLFLLTALGQWAEARLSGACDMRFINVRFGFIRQMNEKRLTMDYPYTEDPKVLDRSNNLWRAIGSNNIGIEGVQRDLFALGGSGVALLGYVAVIATLHPLVLAYLLLNVFITYLLSLRAKRFEEAQRDEMAARDRRANYVYDTMYKFEFGKEIRLYGMGDWLAGLFSSLRGRRLGLQKQISRRHLLPGLVEGAMLFLREGIVYAYLIYAVLAGRIGLGDFALYLSAVAGFATWMRQVLQRVANILAQNLPLNQFRAFLELQDQPSPAHPAPIPTEQPYELTLENVGFRYPGSERWILRDLSFTIPAGTRLALVGVNGAGKTTLVKLLCRFYEPTEGRILLNGVDIANFDAVAYRQLLSVVFQEVKILAMSVLENISLREVERSDRSRVQSALERAGLGPKMASLPRGMDTSLLKILDEQGTELSGGENQRLSLARALYKDAPIVILDEPTAALDPLAEYDLYRHFDGLIGNRTAIYISHRLASTRFCDTVAFFQEGKLLEWGTHDELIRRGGAYANLFAVQARYYQEEVKAI